MFKQKGSINLKFISSVMFALTLIVGGFFIFKTIQAESDLNLVTPANETITTPSIDSKNVIPSDVTLNTTGTVTENKIALTPTFAPAVTNNKIITTSAELIDAINSQADGQTWIIKNGTYNTPRFDNIYMGGQTGWYFPITKNNISIEGESKDGVILTSDVESANGSWASQDHISVWGDNVTIKNLTIQPKIETNKSIEVMGKNFTLNSVNFVQRSNQKENFAGSLYFNPQNDGKDIGTVLVEDVLINDAWISSRTDTVLLGSLTLKNTTIDFRGSAYATEAGYGPISKNDSIIKIADNSFFKVLIDANQKYIQTNIIDRMPAGATLELSPGTYKLDNQLRIVNAINIIGTGDTTIITKNDADWINTSGSKGYAPIITILSGSNKVNLQNFKVTGAKNIVMTVIEAGKNDYGHGINIVNSSDVTLNNITTTSNNVAGLVVNASKVTVNNINTSSNIWGGINVDKGTETFPAILTINGKSMHSETGSAIWKEDNSNLNVKVIDTNNQYVDFTYTHDTSITGTKYILAPISITRPATDIVLKEATLNGINGNYNVDGTSFWVSKSTFVTTSSNVPAGVYNTPNAGALTANAPFSVSLSSTGITLTPNTRYYFAAWSLLNGKWFPGEILNFTTASIPVLTAPTLISPNDNSFTNDKAFINTWSTVSGAVKYEYQTSNDLNNGNMGNIIYRDDSSFSNYTNTPTLISRRNNGTPENTYYWQVRAIDEEGTVGPWSQINKVTVDSIIPNLSITSPTLNQVIKDRIIEIKGTATDANFNYYYCYITDTHGEVGVRDASCTTTWHAVTTDGLLGSITLPNDLADGSYTIYLNGHDKAGNINEVTQSFILDTKTIVEPVIAKEVVNVSSNRSGSFQISQGGLLNTSEGGKVLGAEKFNFTLLTKRGSKGNEVTELQKFITTAGYDSGIADGSFGLKTKSAVIKFQVANNLKGDGVVGAMTRAVLNK